MMIPGGQLHGSCIEVARRVSVLDLDTVMSPGTMLADRVSELRRALVEEAMIVAPVYRCAGPAVLTLTWTQPLAAQALILPVSP